MSIAWRALVLRLSLPVSTSGGRGRSSQQSQARGPPAALIVELESAIDELPDRLSHPLIRRVFPPDSVAEMRHLWTSRHRLLAALDALPQVLCHHDVTHSAAASFFAPDDSSPRLG